MARAAVAGGVAAAAAAAVAAVEEIVDMVLPKKRRATGRDWVVVQRFPRQWMVLDLLTRAHHEASEVGTAAAYDRVEVEDGLW